MEPWPFWLEVIREFVSIILGNSWPLVGLVALMMFRRELTTLLNNIEWAELLGNKLKFGKPRADKDLPKEEPVKPKEVVAVKEIPIEIGPGSVQTPPEGYDWRRVFDIYWLGHDLMWTIDVILRGAPGRFIVRGLSQSLIHFKELNPTDAVFHQKLQKLLDEAQKRLEKEWTPAVRESLAFELRQLIDSFSSIVANKQQQTNPGSLR